MTKPKTKLRQWMDKQNMSYTTLHQKLGISRSYAQCIGAGIMMPSYKLSKRIEEFTNKEVCFQDFVTESEQRAKA